MIFVRISSKDLNHLIVLRLLSLEWQMTGLSISISLLVLLDLSATFDTIDHKIILNRLENFVYISGSALAWFKSYLSDCYQFVAVNEEISYRSHVQYGVPQGSVLGPLIFTLYMLPLGNIIRKHRVSFHCYADDTQLYISSWPGETHQIEKLMECIADIKKWMTSNLLQLHFVKKGVLIIGPNKSFWVDRRPGGTREALNLRGAREALNWTEPAETKVSWTRPVGMKASWTGPAERNASWTGAAETKASWTGPAEMKATWAGPAEMKASWAGPAEMKVSWSGLAEMKESWTWPTLGALGKRWISGVLRKRWTGRSQWRWGRSWG